MTKEESKNMNWQTIYDEMYVKQHHGCCYIAKQIGCDPHTVLRNFKNYGFKIRDNHEKNRKFKCDYNYFDVIDTEDKAYFLGFIYADGYITRNNLGLAIQESDIEILEKLRICMNSDIPIHHYENSGYGDKYTNHCKYCRLIVTSDHMVDSLIKDGVVRNKTTILKPPTCVPNHLLRHFIRGYTDGDGTINRSSNMCRIGWTGTKDFLGWIGEHLKSKGIIDYYGFSKQVHSDKVVSVRFGGSVKPLSVMYYLYENSNYYLSRKYNRYKEYMKWKKPNLSQTVLDSIKDENNG